MSTDDTTPTTAVAKVPVDVGQPLTDLDQAYRLSQALAVATLLPGDLRGKPADVLAILLYGNDLGLSPMQAIQGIYVVKGKPQLSAQTWTALARRAGHKVVWGERTDQAATVTITRADDPENPLTITYTIEDAVQARLVAIKDGKPYARSAKGDPLPWETYTKTMLCNRAISTGGKLQCPEVAMGFAIEGDYDYIPDEDVEVVAPEHHGEVVQADPESVAAELADIEAIVDAEVVDELPLDEKCPVCGGVGDHDLDLHEAAGVPA